MLKRNLILLVLSLVTVDGVYAQINFLKNDPNEKSPTVKFLNRRGYTFPDSTNTKAKPRKWPDTLYYNTPYKATLLGTPTIPISFNSIENATGQYAVSPTLSIGYGYAWFFGDFILNEDDKVTVDPTFFFGPIASVSLQSYLNFTHPTGLFVGGFVGLSAFSLLVGYDILNHSANLGIGGRIDFYTIRQLALKPWGKVKEVRKHKSIAVPVGNE